MQYSRFNRSFSLKTLITPLLWVEFEQDLVLKIKKQTKSIFFLKIGLRETQIRKKKLPESTRNHIKLNGSIF